MCAKGAFKKGGRRIFQYKLDYLATLCLALSQGSDGVHHANMLEMLCFLSVYQITVTLRNIQLEPKISYI